MPASRTLALLLAAAGLATGCGASTSNSASKFSGVKKDVATTVDDLAVGAAKKSDEAKICTDLLTPALIATLRRGERVELQHGGQRRDQGRRRRST